MEKRVDISVVLAWGNDSIRAQTTLESILGQTADDFEVLIPIHDYESEEVGERIKQLSVQNERIRSLSFNENAADAFLRAVREAKGRYSVIAQAGDEFKPTMFALLCELASSDNLDFVQCDFWEDEEESMPTYRMIHRSSDFYRKAFNPLGEMPYFFRLYQRAHRGAGLYRTSFLRRLLGERSEFSEAALREPCFNFLVYAFADRGMFIDQPLCRWDGGALKDGAEPGALALCDRYGRMLEGLQGFPEVRERMMAGYCLRSFSDVRAEVFAAAPEDRPRLLFRFSEMLGRLEQSGQLNVALFSKGQKDEMRMIIDDPMDWFYGRDYRGVIRQLNRRIENRDQTIATLRERTQKQQRQLEEQDGRLAAQAKRIDGLSKKFGNRVIDGVRHRMKKPPASKRASGNGICETVKNGTAKRDSPAPMPSFAVSMASCKARIGDCPKAVKSLMDQSLPPERIDLWLPEGDFPQREKELPRALLDQRAKGLVIHWVAGLGSFGAFHYGRQLHPGIPLVVASDGVLCSPRTLEQLWKAHRMFPEAVCACAAKKIKFTYRGEVAPCATWEKASFSAVPVMGVMGQQTYGILYPTSFQCDLLDDRGAFVDVTSPAEVDVWLKTAQYITATPTYHVDALGAPKGMQMPSQGALDHQCDEALRTIIERLKVEGGHRKIWEAGE